MKQILDIIARIIFVITIGVFCLLSTCAILGLPTFVVGGITYWVMHGGSAVDNTSFCILMLYGTPWTVAALAIYRSFCRVYDNEMSDDN